MNLRLLSAFAEISALNAQIEAMKAERLIQISDGLWLSLEEEKEAKV